MSHHTWVNTVLIYLSTEAPRGSGSPGLWPFPYPSPAVDPIIRGLEQRAEPRCLLESSSGAAHVEGFLLCLFIFWLIGLVWFLHPILIQSYLVRPDHGNAGWRKSLRGEKMLQLQERFWEAEVLVWEGTEVSLLDASPPFPAPPWLGKQGLECGSEASPALPFSLGGNVFLVEFLLQAWH